MSALLLVAVQFLPLWKIDLHAPQYPEGIGMLIRIDTLTGVKEADLDNLNGLNHYIGMRAISTNSFPALDVMPWIAAGLSGFALLVALIGRRVALTGWLAAMMLAGMAGMAEFYRWSYRYGHDLAPDAIIKVPGMTYQPPILGSKQLLNFTADSWPAIGGWLAVAAFVLGAIAWLPVRRRVNAAIAAAPSSMVNVAGLAALAMLLLGACSRSATPAVAYGRADCELCHMRIVDTRYGALAVSEKGRNSQFDSIECLANFAARAASLNSVWVTDFDHPGTLIDATTARYVKRSEPASEMGAGIIAFALDADTSQIRARFGSLPLSWQDIRSLAAQGQLRNGAAAEHEHAH